MSQKPFNLDTTLSYSPSKRLSGCLLMTDVYNCSKLEDVKLKLHLMKPF